MLTTLSQRSSKIWIRSHKEVRVHVHIGLEVTGQLSAPIEDNLILI